MQYIDTISNEILTEDEIWDRVHNYVDKSDIIETMEEIGLYNIYKEMCDSQKQNIYEQTIERLIGEGSLFCVYNDEEDE